MNYLRHIVTLFLVCCTALLNAQEPSSQLVLISESQVNFDRFIGVDQFGFTYYINSNVLYKSKIGQQEVFQFQDFALGQITKVDITNPLKVTLYYEKANSVIILDNRLNELTRVNFNKSQPMMLTAMVSTSRQDQLWVVDMNAQLLHQFNFRSQTLVNSSLPLNTPFNHFASGYNYFFFANDNTVFGFNVYSNKVFELVTGKLDYLSFSYPNLAFIKTQNLHMINIESKKELIISLENIPYQDVYLNAENFYIYDQKNLKTFKVSE